MGYSPGEFAEERGGNLHWELKDGPRVVLWDADESVAILRLGGSNIRKCYEQLRTIAMLLEIE